MSLGKTAEPFLSEFIVGESALKGRKFLRKRRRISEWVKEKKRKKSGKIYRISQ
jgi:hypothetical protein